jgi:hypothetical protein
MKAPCVSGKVLSKAIRLLNGNPSARDGLSPYVLLTGEAPTSPYPNYVAIATAVGYTPELGRKSLLLKTPHTLFSRYREVKLG